MEEKIIKILEMVQMKKRMPQPYKGDKNVSNM